MTMPKCKRVLEKSIKVYEMEMLFDAFAMQILVFELKKKR